MLHRKALEKLAAAGGTRSLLISGPKFVKLTWGPLSHNRSAYHPSCLHLIHFKRNTKGVRM